MMSLTSEFAKAMFGSLTGLDPSASSVGFYSRFHCGADTFGRLHSFRARCRRAGRDCCRLRLRYLLRSRFLVCLLSGGLLGLLLGFPNVVMQADCFVIGAFEVLGCTGLKELSHRVPDRLVVWI